MNIENTLNTAIKTLTQFNIPNANLDSEILLAKIIGKDRNYIILNSKEHLNQKYLFRFNSLIERRKKGEPVAYLTRKKEFWKNDFYVDQNVLVPRPDTELIVEEVLKFSKKKFKLQILDIGTGSGCILLSLLKEIPSFYGTGIDISAKAIDMAKKNSKNIICYGAPAKGNTLLNYCGFSKTLIDYTVDKNPNKQNLFLPGTHIPIFSPENQEL